jgi:glutaminyl-tRNA synthetase
MEFINPNSLNIIKAFVEPSLKEARIGDRFQFQRLGYFNVDSSSSKEHLVFNKTVGLRDNWAKQKTNHSNNQNQQKSQQPQRKPIDVIKQLGKKYTNLPEEKRQKVKAEIKELAKQVTYDDLEPLFATAVKKTGTRIAVMIALTVLLDNGLQRNRAINDFINKAMEDKSELLVIEAKDI